MVCIVFVVVDMCCDYFVIVLIMVVVFLVLCSVLMLVNFVLSGIFGDRMMSGCDL